MTRRCDLVEVLRVFSRPSIIRFGLAVFTFLRILPNGTGGLIVTLQTLFQTRASCWTVLIRLLVGLVVFFPEGIQKLAFPAILGAGRFTRIGIPYPDLMGPFVGVVEIVCGALIIAGLLTRLAAFPLIIIMVVAIVSRKCPFGLDRTFGFSTCQSSTVTVSGAWPTRREPISLCRSAASTC